MDVIHSFQLCQDHLETWFSCVRRGVGSNDNPTASEFKRLYRKLLVCHEITYDGNKANCISNETGILTVSSEFVPKSKMGENVNEILEIDFSYHEALNEKLEKFDEHLNAFAAFKVQRKIIQNIQTHKEKCASCIEVFQENERVDDDFIARKNIPDQPCKSTVAIIKAANKIMFILPNEEFNFSTVALTILNHLYFDDLYVETDFESHITAEEQTNCPDATLHKRHFLLNVVKAYIHIKANKIGGKISNEERGVYIQHINKKLIHQAGQ